MQYKKMTEFSVGVLMIIAILAVLFLAFRVSGLTNLSNNDTYTVTAQFANIGDLKVRAPVTIAGVVIGKVSDIQLDPVSFKAVVKLAINKKDNQIPVDSTANIYTAGLLGANYISLSPGFENTYLKNGDVIQNTNQALILQNLIGQLLFSLKGGNNNTNKASQ